MVNMIYYNGLLTLRRPDHRQAVDVAHVQSLIDENTVAIVGSACQFASGAKKRINKWFFS